MNADTDQQVLHNARMEAITNQQVPDNVLSDANTNKQVPDSAPTEVITGQQTLDNAEAITMPMDQKLTRDVSPPVKSPLPHFPRLVGPLPEVLYNGLLSEVSYYCKSLYHKFCTRYLFSISCCEPNYDQFKQNSIKHTCTNLLIASRS